MVTKGAWLTAVQAQPAAVLTLMSELARTKEALLALGEIA
jgi:hypothetical protein